MKRRSKHIKKQKHSKEIINDLFDIFPSSNDSSFNSDNMEEANGDQDLNKSYDFRNYLKQNDIPNNNNKNKKSGKILSSGENKIKLIKYSNKEMQVYSNLIYQYFYDKFKTEDYINAKRILFFGDNLKERIKAINAYFNIVKGINLDENERFILIENEKSNKQFNLGIHMYYIKDNNNKSFILINCNGYGEDKNKENDDKLNEAFKLLFEKLVKQINLICFVIKENDERVNIFQRYIIGCVTNLLSEDILKNFIYLVTDINIYNIKQRPQISITLYNDIYYDYIKYKIDKKWFYSINADSLFNNEINELSKYSYSQLIELHKEKVQNSIKISTHQSFEIVKNRIDIKNYVNNIISKFKTLKKEDDKLSNLNSFINSYNEKIKKIEDDITLKNENINYINNSLDKINTELSELENQHNNKMYELDNEYETITIKVLDSSSYKHTICYSCKTNCHPYCECFWRFGSCKVFPLFDDYCDECGHSKDSHDTRIKMRYIDKEEQRKINNDDKKYYENERYNEKKNEFNIEINNKKNEKEKIYEEINDLNNEINNLEIDKSYYVKEKNEVNDCMKILYKEISDMINILIDISNKIEKNALNKFHIEIENDYIDYLIDEITKKDNNEIKIQKLIKRKQINILYRELSSNYLYLFGFKYGAKFNI